MFDRYAGRLYDFTARHKRFVQLVLIFLIIISLAALFFVKYESSMYGILPKNEVITRSIDFFRDSNIAGKVIVSLELTSPDKDQKDLLRGIDLLAGSMDKSLFPAIAVGLSESSSANAIDKMFENLPGMVSGNEIAQIESWINEERVSQKLHEAYLQLLRPQGVFMNSMLRSDPLGLRMLVLEKLKILSSSTGYDVEIKDGYFVSRDGRHAMLIANSAVPVTDSEGSRKLLDSLKNNLGKLPEYISADIICGHAHVASNEKTIRRDINFISIVAAAVLILLYVFVIRDFSAVLIFIVPVTAILFSIVLSYLFLGKLLYWVIGMGATVAGITIDYGTHVYFSARGKSDPSAFVKHVIKPVSFGAFTTIAIFIAFFFSKIEGYNQLAVFTIITVILSAAISIFVLPHLIVKTTGRSHFADRAANRLESKNLSNGLTVLSWFFLTFALAWFAAHVGFERDIKKIDGTEKNIIQAEERFHKTWGGEKTPAVLVVSSKNYEEALEMNERVYNDAVQAVGAGNFTSIALLLPSEKTRKENSERWNKFWSEERKQKLKKLFSEEGRKYNFSENAFEPFFASLKVSRFDNTPLSPLNRGETDIRLFERFVQKTSDGYRLMSFFPDTEEFTDLLNEVSSRHPDTYLVSATVLSDTLSEVVSADLKLMIWISAISVIVLTYLCFFNIRETLIALVPPVTGIIWLMGIISLLGLTINAANMIAGVLAIGLASDYGIFMVYKSRFNIQAGTVLAITLCTLTTLIGAGVLIFAKHPALSSVGVTMLIGVGAGFLSSIVVVPKLCELFVNKSRQKIMKRLPILFILLICLTSCANIPFKRTSYVPMESADPWALVEQFRNNSPEKFTLIDTIVFGYNWNKLSALGYIKADAVEKTFTAVGINPMGVKLFELTGDKDRVVPHFVMEQFSRTGNFAGTVGEDIRRIYFDLTPSSGALVNKKKFKIVFSEPAGPGILEYIFAGPAGFLVEKNYYEDGILNWRVSYYEYLQKDGKNYPSGIILENYRYGYSLTIKLKEIRV